LLLFGLIHWIGVALTAVIANHDILHLIEVFMSKGQKQESVINLQQPVNSIQIKTKENEQK